MAKVINNKMLPEKKACSLEMKRANATVAARTPRVITILSLRQEFGVLLRSIGSCPNTRTDSRINEKPEEELGNREASTTDADNAALIEITDVNRSEDTCGRLRPP